MLPLAFINSKISEKVLLSASKISKMLLPASKITIATRPLSLMIKKKFCVLY